jgi:putative transcriptional regulator
MTSMDSSFRGQLLVATPALQEPTFARTVIAMLEHDPTSGALGVVLNRPTTVALAEALPAASALVTAPAVVFDGGPVSRQTAIALGVARPDAPADGWSPLVAPLVTVDLDADPALLAAALRRLRVFAGYAGWSAGQLEREVEDGSWYVVDALPDDPFRVDPEHLRADVLRRQGWPLAAATHAPLDPSQN